MMPNRKDNRVCFLKPRAALLFLPLLLAGPVAAQEAKDAPLTADREADSYAIAEQVYAQARSTKEEKARAVAMYRAAGLFNTYVTDYPKAANRDKALYYLAVCQAEAGDAAGSDATLAHLAETAQGEYAAAAAFKLGAKAMTRRDWNSAILSFCKVQEQTKRAALRNDACFRLALSQKEAGQNADAKASFQKVLQMSELTPELRQKSLYLLAQLNTVEAQDAEAYRLFCELLKEENVDKSIREQATLQAARLAAKLGKGEESQKWYAQLNSMPGMGQFSAEAQLESLIGLYSEKKYEEVVRAAEQGDIKQPDPVKEARLALIVGQSCTELKAYDKAIAWFERAEKAKPDTPMAADAGYRRLLCIRQSNNLDFYPKALEYLKVYGAPKSKTAELPCLDLVRLMYADGMMKIDAASAAEQFAALRVENLPENVRADALYKKAWSAASGDTYDPLPELTKFIETYPQDSRLPEALALRGTAYAKKDKLKEALDDFDRVIRDYPENDAAAVAWQRAAQACARRTQDKEAQQKMVHYYEGLIHYDEEAVKRGAKSRTAALAEAHYNIACALYESAPAEAVKHFIEARRQDAEKYGALADLRLVQCYFKMKDAAQLQTALAALEKSSPAGYRSLPAGVLRWCGWMCFRNKDYAAADKLLTDALPREPKETYKGPDGSDRERPKVEPLVWKSLAHARLELGRYAEGAEAAQHYVSMETQPYRKAEGMNDEAQLLLGLNRAAEARKLCEDAIAMGVDGPLKSALFITLGDTYYAEKQFAEAAKYYGRTANVASDAELKPNALYRLACALRRCGRTSEAEPYETTLTTEFPNWKPDKKVEGLMNRP